MSSALRDSIAVAHATDLDTLTSMVALAGQIVGLVRLH